MIVDVHVHLGIRQQIWGMKKNTAENQIAMMDDCGIDRACVFSPASGLIRPEHFREANDYVAEASKKYAHRLIPFCIVNPWYGQETSAEIDRNVARGFAGIKLYPTGHGYYPIDSPIVDVVVEAGIRLQVPILIHTDYNSKVATPYQFANLATRWPEAKLIMAHMGMDPDLVHFTAALIKDLPNTYVDISATPDLPDSVVKQPVEILGSERVLFGSDGPTLHPKLTMLKVKLAGLSEDDEKNVMGESILRLLKLQK